MNITLVVCDVAPAVPVTVTVYVPGVVVAPAVNVSVELRPAVTLVGAKAAVAPAGSPVADNAIDCALPAVDIVWTVVVPLRPAPRSPCSAWR